ncbi:MAG: DUF5597 domain-containing protein [Lachnospiraceae bacterium]|nr:DUF5597 domain-containing protein [Lachnospiraceae bacterium]
MKNDFLKDENGNPFMAVGVQAHNSSTGTPLIQKAIHVVKKYGGNCLEAPVYWYRLEPEENSYDMSLVKGLIDEVRASGLKLIILWFGMSKNGHPNYAPEYIKQNSKKYHIAKGADGAPVASLSPHCSHTLARDEKAFGKLMEFLKDYDCEARTVLAVQIENEMGYANTDMDYSESVREIYMQEVPECLQNITLENSGAEELKSGALSPWRQKFGRYAHEAFSAWHHAKYIEQIAQTGKAIYDLPLFINVMVGESGYEEAGLCYNAGAAVGRMLDIWKAGAPSLDLICPDIYNQNQREYQRICQRYARPDNPLFIPESPLWGEANAMNALIAAASFGAIGICCFGAEHALDADGNLVDQCRDMTVTMRTLANMIPLLIRYRGTGQVYAVCEEEFETSRYIKLADYHVIAHFMHTGQSRLGYTQELTDQTGKDKTQIRGRALLIQTGKHEFFAGGAGVSFDFIRRPAPDDENSYCHLSSRQSGQLNFLSVEEGHFEGDNWVIDFIRNGDETNFSHYVLDGQVIRIRLNPDTGIG